MSDPSVPLPIEKPDTETEAAPEESLPNGRIVYSTEQKQKPTGASARYPMRTVPVKKKAKQKELGPLEIVCSWIVEHQIGLSVNLLMLLALTHLCFPRARRHTRKFFELSYYNAESGEFCAGWNDAWMVLYWIVIFTGLRASIMDYLLKPMAKRGGIATAKNQVRFAEQAWLLIYVSVFWTLGAYLLGTADYWYDLKNLWTNWPNREIPRLRKWYILVQYAFWLQQIFVIHIEERRKDYWHMFIHHIITTTLIFTSYGYHQTKVANMILCIMDDVRSDDEGDNEEEALDDKMTYEEFDQAELPPYEEEVGVEAINLKGRTSKTRYKKVAGSATGVSLPGASDRKELLGRIGCDKGT